MATREARGEQLSLAQVERLESDLGAALRRKPSHEGRLGGAVRSLLPLSPRLAEAADAALATLVKRGSFGRPLYAALARGLAAAESPRACPHLSKALAADDAGGLASLSAATWVGEPELGDALARAATSRHPHLAFAAEVARVARGESNGAHITSLAPKIKESHRIDLCSEIFVPLSWVAELPLAIAPALSVLRGSERHLGRWLVFGSIGVRAGDETPLVEARSRATEGPSSARAAWAMVAWALEPAASPPDVRPTVELVARLSDRPSSDRDTTFLFRLARAGAPTARPMLESMAKGSTLSTEGGVRAALHLIRDHGKDALLEALANTAKSPRREALRGLAAAALYDCGERALAKDLAAPLAASKQLQTMAWGALVSADLDEEIVTEPRFRHVQLGWPE